MIGFVGRSPELGRLGEELRLVRQTGAGRFVWLRGRRRVPGIQMRPAEAR